MRNSRASWPLRPNSISPVASPPLVRGIGSEIAQTFYNSMLPELSPPEQIGKWSGLGWGLGYIAGIVGLKLSH